ncbi:hypothetical protein C0J52_12042 [Blattella germanica]|nr:hypothetical protein C0J52_12042 [Blattella germanica]
MDGSCNCSFVDTPFLSGACGSGSIFFMSLVQNLIMSHPDIADPCRRHPDNPDLVADDQFDFIVVGAGVAGPVVASRLSENPEWKVLLLEAGPNEPSVTSVPAFAMSAVGSVLDWKYVTENTTRACLSTGGRCQWPRGKMESGSSGMQGMMYTRPHRSIFDEWNKNNPGWSFDEILPYYKKSEKNLNPEIIDAGHHGIYGPMTIQQFPSKPSLCNDIVEAGKQLGYVNGPSKDLQEVGIDVVVDLPGVGHNLQHHVAASIGFFMDDAEDTITLTSEAVMEFINNRTGNLASTGVTQTTLFMLSKYATGGIPDLQVRTMPKVHFLT